MIFFTTVSIFIYDDRSWTKDLSLEEADSEPRIEIPSSLLVSRNPLSYDNNSGPLLPSFNSRDSEEVSSLRQNSISFLTPHTVA